MCGAFILESQIIRRQSDTAWINFKLRTVRQTIWMTQNDSERARCEPALRLELRVRTRPGMRNLDRSRIGASDLPDWPPTLLMAASRMNIWRPPTDSGSCQLGLTITGASLIKLSVPRHEDRTGFSDTPKSPQVHNSAQLTIPTTSSLNSSFDILPGARSFLSLQKLTVTTVDAPTPVRPQCRNMSISCPWCSVDSLYYSSPCPWLSVKHSSIPHKSVLNVLQSAIDLTPTQLESILSSCKINRYFKFYLICAAWFNSSRSSHCMDFLSIAKTATTVVTKFVNKSRKCWIRHSELKDVKKSATYLGTETLSHYGVSKVTIVTDSQISLAWVVIQ